MIFVEKNTGILTGLLPILFLKKKLEEIKNKNIGIKLPSIVFYYDEFEGRSCDDICRDKYGHSNWVKLDTLSDQEKVGLDEVAEIVTIKGIQVAFYYEEEGEQDE
tara:strand:- start:930 stop:1244 length:315 start_codon:yes stop_codon:yes gene_type:complete